MSHDEERGNGARARNNRDRAPRHWLNPLVSRQNSHTYQVSARALELGLRDRGLSGQY